MQKKEDYPEETIEREGGKKQMTYKELFAVADVLNDICQGKELKVNHNTKIDLGAAGNYFKNVISDIDKKRARTKEDVMHYRLTIEVNR